MCVRVCVTSPLLKVPAYLADLAARRNFYVLMREIYYMGVVTSSVQLFRKWEIKFDSEECSVITRVLLFVSEAQGMWPSSRDIKPSNAESAQWLFCSCDVKSVEAPNYLSTVPRVALPWSVKEKLVEVVPPSVEAFWKWENNSDLIQFTDYWHCTAVTNRLSSKAGIGFSAFSWGI